MSDNSTKQFIQAYYQDATPIQFLSGFFRSPRENFHLSESIEIDIQRSGEDVSIVVTDLSSGYRENSANVFTNKEIVPPIHKELVPLNSGQLIKRMPGQNPYADRTFRARLVDLMMRNMRLQENKIRRSNEWQASQVLQTGTTTLVDANGVALYSIDFQPKATHFPTVGTAWDDVSPDIAGDLLSLATVLKADGFVTPDLLIMGEGSFETFIQDADIQARLDNRRIDGNGLVAINPVGQGGVYQGMFQVGSYKFQIWTYPGRYKHPQTGNSTPFVADNKVIMMSSVSTRLDATYGGVPHIGRELGISGQNILPELPSRFGSSENGMDMFTNVWLTQDGENLNGGIASRPLFIPTAIDTYGCLDTGI